MTKQIKCPNKNLEGFIKYGEQVPAYRFISGNADPKQFNQKSINHYNLGKEYSKQFDEGNDFLESLRIHVNNCERCHMGLKEMKNKYSKLEKEGIERLDRQVRINLEYFGLLDKVRKI